MLEKAKPPSPAELVPLLPADGWLLMLGAPIARLELELQPGPGSWREPMHQLSRRFATLHPGSSLPALLLAFWEVWFEQRQHLAVARMDLEHGRGVLERGLASLPPDQAALYLEAVEQVCCFYQHFSPRADSKVLVEPALLANVEHLRQPHPEPPPPVYLVEAFASVSLASAIEWAKNTQIDEVEAWLETSPMLLFDSCRQECPQVALVREASRVPESLWIVGDLHGDVLALANLCTFVFRENPLSSIVFLGDFIDRGAHDHETLLLLFGLLRDHPGRIAVLPGNHDLELSHDPGVGQFRSGVSPAEYAERLNRNPGSDAHRLAEVFVRFMAGRPRAVILPDGTLLTHGGFPHTDLLEGIRSPADLGKGRCPRDFSWLRIADTAERKRPNPGSKGCQFGYGDFARFCLKMTEIGIPVCRMVRGHDHEPARFRYYEAYQNYPVLTLNGMSWASDEEKSTGVREVFPCAGRYRPGLLPAVYRLPLPPEEVQRAAPRESENES